ncbi:nucleotide exchange factor GrpE [Catellatospora vulcania]|uniref:nucleotide exchange factor GrpE n=1 Tax=Catellatospora vulcania TaxID=1460450 RepID=UPI0012D48F1C|nr:nucleotide exchange factor GrpE [Catellatospora vulcania]
MAHHPHGGSGPQADTEPEEQAGHDHVARHGLDPPGPVAVDPDEVAVPAGHAGEPSAEAPDIEAPAGPSAAELEGRLRRALADLDNMRKRYERQLASEREAERARTAAVFLPVVDNLDLALAHADSDPAAVVDGVRAVRDQAVNTLSTLGFPRREDTGMPFDPVWHEAVSVVPNTGEPDGTVLQVIRPGYGEVDRQLRPATVVVAGNTQG